MLRYLKAAFWVRQPVPLLGAVPVNLLAVIGFFVLGIGHPAFWLLGLLGETAYLWSMSSSVRFRNLVDALERHAGRAESEDEQSVLLQQLSKPAQERVAALQRQLVDVQRAYQQFAGDDSSAEGNLSSLRDLECAYVKLLTAREHIHDADQRANGSGIQGEIQEIEADLQQTTLSRVARDSKEATLELLRKRLAAGEQRRQKLDEIDSDLERIEAQFSLAVESSATRAKPEELHLDVDLASRLISTPDVTVTRLSE